MSTKKLILYFAIIIVVSCFGISFDVMNNNISRGDQLKQTLEAKLVDFSSNTLKASTFNPLEIYRINKLAR